MPKIHKRKTNWVSTPLEEMERAATNVKAGKSIRAVAKEKVVDTSTVRRCRKKEGGKGSVNHRLQWNGEGKEGLHRGAKEGASDHIKKLADHIHGQIPKNVVNWHLNWKANNIAIPNNWKEKALQGVQWI